MCVCVCVIIGTPAFSEDFYKLEIVLNKSKQNEAQSARAESTQKKNVLLVEFMYLVFTRMPGESYRRRLRSLLYLCYVFRSLIHPIVC